MRAGHCHLVSAILPIAAGAHILCIVLPKSVRALGDFHDLWDATLVVVVLQEDQLFSRFRWLFNLNEMLRHLRCLCLDLWDFLSLHNIIYVNIVQI